MSNNDQISFDEGDHPDQQGSADDEIQEGGVRPSASTMAGYPSQGNPVLGGPVVSGGDARRRNTLSIVGFVLAFVFWIAGLIVSIIAVVKTKDKREKGHGLAIAGIIIAIVNAVVTIIITISFVVAAENAVSAAASRAGNAPYSSATRAPSTTNGNSHDGMYDNIEQFLASPAGQESAHKIEQSLNSDGMAYAISGQGNTLVCTVTLTQMDSVSAEHVNEVNAQLDRMEGSTDLDSFTKSLGELTQHVKDPNMQIKLAFVTNTGASVASHVYKFAK